MDDSSLSKYSSYIGKKVKYYSVDGLLGMNVISEGKLVDIKYNDKTKSLDAIVETEFKKPEGGVLIRKRQIPVTDIIQNRTQGTSRNDKISSPYMKSTKETTSITKPPLPPYRSCFRMGGNRYDSLSIDTLKISDDVVWIPYTEDNVPLVGKIKFIGKCSQDSGNDETVAVVQFDLATNKYPRYLERADPNQNLVDVNELVPLSTWTESYTQEHERLSSKPTKEEVNTASMDDMDTKVYNLCKKFMEGVQVSEDKKMGDDFTQKASEPGTSASFASSNSDVHVKLEVVNTVPQNILNVTPSDLPTGPLADYNVAKLPIKICTSNDKTYKIMTRTDWTVERLKKEFMEYWKPNSPDPFTLQYKTTILSDDMLLTSYNIEPDSIIQAVPKYDSALERQEEMNLPSNNTSHKLQSELIGNCIAVKKGTVPVEVKEIKPGSIMIARTDLENITVGKVNLTCTIQDYGETIYVGVKFRKQLPFGSSGIQIQHLDLSEGHCEKCNGRRSLFIPMDQVGSSKDKLFEVQ